MGGFVEHTLTYSCPACGNTTKRSELVAEMLVLFNRYTGRRNFNLRDISASSRPFPPVRHLLGTPFSVLLRHNSNVKMPVPFAEAAYVVRAANKDAYYISTLTEQVMSVVTSIMGMRFTNNNEDHVATLAKLLYVASTFAGSKQTIGEEFTDLLPVTSSAAAIGPTRRTLFMLLLALEGYAIRQMARRLFPSVSAKDVADHLRNIHHAFFFFFGAYYTLPHRFSAIRLGALTPPQRGTPSDSGSYRLIGLMLAMQYTVMLLQFLRERRHDRSTGGRAGGSSGSPASDRNSSRGHSRGEGRDLAAEDEPRDEEEDDEAAARRVGKCTLCLGARNAPTATLCGHIFCWECILDWCAANQPNALCPLCRQIITPQSLVRLVSYRQPEK